VTDPWRAAEAFVSSSVEGRRQGLAALTAGECAFSPLALYLLASRLNEPDLALRREVIAALARCIEPDASAELPPARARDYLASLLAQFGRSQVEWLLEAALPAEPARFLLDHWAVAVLLDRVPHLAGLLTRIAADRSTALEVRLAAIAAAGDMGVMEALPALEGLRTRVEGQSAGQLAMTFAPAPERDLGLILSTVNAAIHSLRENV
jgi:hypothetical protein